MEIIPSPYTPWRYIPYLQEISPVVIPLCSFLFSSGLLSYWRPLRCCRLLLLLPLLCCLLRGPRQCGVGGGLNWIWKAIHRLSYLELRHRSIKAISINWGVPMPLFPCFFLVSEQPRYVPHHSLLRITGPTANCDAHCVLCLRTLWWLCPA